MGGILQVSAMRDDSIEGIRIGTETPNRGPGIGNDGMVRKWGQRQSRASPVSPRWLMGRLDSTFAPVMGWNEIDDDTRATWILRRLDFRRLAASHL